MPIPKRKYVHLFIINAKNKEKEQMESKTNTSVKPPNAIMPKKLANKTLPRKSPVK